MRRSLIISFELLLLTMGVLCSCGDSKKTGAEQNEYVYVVSGSESMSFDGYLNLNLIDGWLYYNQGSVLQRIPVSDTLISNEDTADEILEKAWLLKSKAETVYTSGNSFTYALDAEGNLYIFEVLSRLNAQYQREVTGKKLKGIGVDGSVLYEVDFSEIQEIPYDSISASFGIIVPIQADLEGNVYVLMDGAIYVVDKKGAMIARTLTEGFRKEEKYDDDHMTENLIRGQNGTVYYIAEGRGRGYDRWCVWEIAAAEGYSLQEIEAFQGNYEGIISGGMRNLAVIGKDGFLYEYDPEESSVCELLRWEDSNIEGYKVKAVFQLSDEYLLVVCQDWEKGPSRYLCHLLKKTDINNLPKKEVIVLASLFPDEYLESAVVDFNLSNMEYHITIESYGYKKGSPTEEEAARLRLDSALVSSRPPDLLDLSSLDISKYASRDVLEDLTLYIEQSEHLSIEDYFENIIEGYTIDKKLVCVPSYFYITGFFGRSLQLGREPGWSFDDMKRLVERYPEHRLMDNANYRGSDWIWQNAVDDYCLDKFVDLSSRTCDFQNEEFGEIVKWVGEHHGEGEIVWDWSEADDLLLDWYHMGNLSDYIKYETIYEDSYAFKGYPTIDGSLRYEAQPTDEVGIVSASDKKEGAWEFLEYFMGLNDNPEMIYGIGFNSRRTFTEKALEYLMEIEYLYDMNGKESIRLKGYFMKDGESYDFYYLRKDQADQLMEMLDSVDFRPKSNVENAIIDIIVEETESFYNGDKSLEEVMAIIQNRARLLLWEES